MKVALAQLDPKVGDFPGNVAKITKAIAAARAQGARLLVLPELTVTGYPPRDLLDYDRFVDDNLAALDAVAKAAHGITVVCGYVERNPAPTGRPYFNAAGVLRDGKVIASYRKQLLPYYDVFDEERYFEPGPSACTSCVFELDGKRVAVTICEDIWNASNYLKRPYVVRPLDVLRGQRPDLVVNLSASPFNLGKPATRIKLFGEAAAALGAPVLFCNQVGGNDELLFDGASFALSPAGAVLARAKAFAEELLVFETSGEGPLAAWPETDEAWLFEALSMGLGDYVRKCGASKVCLGLSGGIDSSVVAAVAAHALGPENVSALALPSRYTASASLEDAALLARKLGIEYKVCPIESVFELYQNLWQNWFKHKPVAVTLENLQPRIRMTILMAYANEGNRLLLNTSNKSEIACGYATLYGDSSGAIAVLGDLTKDQVYALARHLNRAGEVIPRRVLERPPTAELRENQTDQDTLPPYDVLDGIVRATLVDLASPAQLVESGYPAAAVKTFGRLFAGSEYKRHQLPPALRVSARAFGVGRRVPIASAKPWEG